LIVDQLELDGAADLDFVVLPVFEIATVKENTLTVARSNHPAKASMRQLGDATCRRTSPFRCDV
jgi:hypothetical protein